MENWSQWLPLLAPIVLIQLALAIIALLDLIRCDRTKGPKWVWGLVIVFFNIIGPVVYLVIGREE